MEAHGNRLRAALRGAYNRGRRPKALLVSYDVFCACMEGMQFWPYRDLDGNSYVGIGLFIGDDVHDHLMFYGVPLIPWQPYTLPPGMGLSLLKSERVS